MLKWLLFRFILLFFLFCQGLKAEPQPILSLEQCLQIALQHNAALQQSYLQQQGALIDEDALKERWSPFWQWESQASRYQQSSQEGGATKNSAESGLHMHYELPWGGSLGSRVTTDSDWSVDVHQPLRRGMGSKVAKAPLIFAEQQQKMLHYQIAQQQIDLIQQVISAYRRIQQLERQVNLQQGVVHLAKQNLSAVELRIQAGRVAPNDRFQVAFDVSQQENALKQYQESYQQAREELWLLIGLPAHTEAYFEAFEPTKALPLEWATYERAIEHHPQWEQLQVQKATLEQQQWLAKDSLKTDLNLVGRSSLKREPGMGFGNSGKPDYFVGIQWKVPLNHSKTQRQSLMQVNLMEKQWTLQADYLRHSLLKSVHQAFEEVKLKAEQRILSHEALTWAQKSLLATQQKFEAGRSASFELVAMQQQLQAAEMQAIESDMAYENALTALDAAAGVLKVEPKS